MKKRDRKRIRQVKPEPIQIRNTGFNLGMELAHQNPETDYVLGAASQKCLAEMPTGIRHIYLPSGELQFGREDFMDCVSRSINNTLATKFNYLLTNKLISEELIKWLGDKGYITESGVDFSDRFLAIKSKTSRSGNSLIQPLQTVHSVGAIPKSLLPASSDMDFDTYHNPASITKEMEDLGLEFLKRFNINYEKVYASQFENFLQRDMLHTAGYSWSQPEGGIYPRVDYPFNHSFQVYEPLYFAFDNYFDEGRTGDWIKQLASNYNLIDPSYRLIITLNTTKPKGTTWKQLLRWFGFVVI